MAYTQNPGRSPLLKTGNGIPSALLQQTKPDFTGSTDRRGLNPNTDLLKVAKHYGSKVVSKVKDVASKTGEYLSDLAEGKKGNTESGTASSMREKNIVKKKK